MHDVRSVCFVSTDSRPLGIACIIHMCYKCGLHFRFVSSQFRGLPTELPTVSMLESH